MGWKGDTASLPVPEGTASKLALMSLFLLHPHNQVESLRRKGHNWCVFVWGHTQECSRAYF